MTTDTATIGLEEALRRAAAEHAKRLRAEESGGRARFEAVFLLRQLGLGTPGIPAASDGGTAATNAAQERETAILRLDREAARQARLARAGSPRYDLNRHIALRRLIRKFQRAGHFEAARSEASGRTPPTGRVLRQPSVETRMGGGSNAAHLGSKNPERIAAPAKRPHTVRGQSQRSSTA